VIAEILLGGITLFLPLYEKRGTGAASADAAIGRRIEDEGIVIGVGQLEKSPISSVQGGNRKLARGIVQAGVVFCS